MILSSFFLLHLFCFTNLLLFHVVFTSSLPPLCHGEERSALLQFKDSFVIDCQASIDDDSLAYPKVEYWMLHHLHDCCSWDGVTCDNQTGDVIGLDLSSSCLFGSINSTSTLFQLVHLRSLNLAHNNFNHSQIPSHIAQLSQLTYLDLSFSHFDGQIPPNISQLSKLTTLDLNSNDKLMLKSPDFDRLVQNLTSLEALGLSTVHISSAIPLTLANLSSLKHLTLTECELYGDFPVGIFQLPHLRTIKAVANSDLNGYLPEFNASSPLQTVMLTETSFSGKIPDSIGNLASLTLLIIANSGLFGQVPASLGNLLKLEGLDLTDTNLQVKDSSSLSWVANLTRLQFIGLCGISSSNKVFPPYFSNLTQLAYFSLKESKIDGQIPPWLANMTQLLSLDLPNNQLQGPIPDSVFQLTNLEYLSFSGNNLSGKLELDMLFTKFRKLNSLYLSYNNLSLLDTNNNYVSNATAVKLSNLELAGCKLNHFPKVLRDQDGLQFLNLADNFIHGPIPTWMLNASKDSLKLIDLSDNYLTGIEQNLNLIPWSRAIAVYLSGNMLRGSLPIPPPSIIEYVIDNNNLNGHISPIICNLSALHILDLSYNNFTGTLPPCFANFSSSILFLNLEGNKFHGKIPDSYTQDCNLRMLSLDSNDFGGEVPRSLSNCTRLEFLILGNNQINDVFPSWLGLLQELKVLILHSNRFHGGLENYISDFDFPMLQIIDISQNNFSRKLPAQYFLNWNAMKMETATQLAYMKTSFVTQFWVGRSARSSFLYSMTITNKGTTRTYSKIIESFVAIDFSSNNFEGEIPQVIGNLIGLRLLNLSNNNLSGGIPTSLANLTDIESLDLSENKFEGQIPQELTKLGFLAVFNVSYNHLMGPVPLGKQFDTFDNSSYQNNSGLCGDPLSRKCENSTWSIQEGVEDSDSFFEFSWKPVVMGYGCGLIVGAVIGRIIVTRKLEWFLKTFRIIRGRMRRT